MPLATLSSIPPVLAKCSSWNLHLDKFSFQRAGAADAKTDTLKTVLKTYERSRSHLEKVAHSRLAWIQNLSFQHGPRFRSTRLYSTSPLILHLGRANVLENVGLYCERTTGLPIIPGTAIKGVLSTWACWEANQNDDGSFPTAERWETRRSEFPLDHARRIFGSNAQEGSDSVGEILFLGAWPASVPKLALDITNPHHDSKGNDLTRLTPSVFLCLEPGVAWDFAFLARAGMLDAPQLLDTTETWLRECFSQFGIGAKTAAGYGRFQDQPASQNISKTASTMSETDRKAHAEAIKKLQSDYPNEAIFKNRVLDKLNNPGQLAQLEKEIATLQKPENADYLEKLKKHLVGREARDTRKRLKEKSWFPQEWLPPQS